MFQPVSAFVNTGARQSGHRLSPSACVGLAAVLAAVVLLPLLGHRPLTDWDEGIYAEIAREMLAGHSVQAWLIPHWNGHLWFEKPPLQMWITAVFLRVFGLTAFAARLPSALAGIAAVATLHAWMQHRGDQFTAWLSTVILLSSFGFQHAARVGETDTLLCAFSLLAILGLAELVHNNPGGWPFFFAGFGLALMTKGAASLPLPLAALTLTALHPRLLLRHGRRFIVGLMIFLVVTLPWHLYLYSQFGRSFLHNYIGFHTLARATGALEGHRTQPWFYLWVLLVSAPFFSLFFPWALATPFRRRTPAAPSFQVFALFGAITLLLFSAAKTRLPHYIVPVYPPLAALTAVFLNHWIRARSAPSAARRTILSTRYLLATALSLYLLAALITAPLRRTLHRAELGNGYATPENRESVTLLQQLHDAGGSLPNGPLLVWRQTPIVPVTTAAFYAHRLAQQVSFRPAPTDLPRDPYFNDPQPFTNFLSAPHLLLFDTALRPQLPPGTQVHVVASGPTQTLGILRRSTTSSP